MIKEEDETSQLMDNIKDKEVVPWDIVDFTNGLFYIAYIEDGECIRVEDVVEENSKKMT